MQRGQLLAQGNDAGGDGAVVVLAFVGTALHAGAPHSFTQIAPRREREKRFGQRRRQGDGAGMVAQPTLGRGVASGRTDGIGQAGEIGLALQLQPPARFLGQQVLGEAGGEFGELLRDPGIPAARFRRQFRAGEDKVEMDAFQQRQIFLIQCERIASRVQRVDAIEQARMHVDRIPVGGQARCHGAFHGLQGRAGFAGRQVAKQPADAGEKAAAAIERLHRVGESRRRRLAGDGIDLGQCGAHSCFEGGFEVLGRDLTKWRKAVGTGPVPQQWIVGDGHGRILLPGRPREARRLSAAQPSRAKHPFPPRALRSAA